MAAVAPEPGGGPGGAASPAGAAASGAPPCLPRRPRHPAARRPGWGAGRSRVPDPSRRARDRSWVHGDGRGGRGGSRERPWPDPDIGPEERPGRRSTGAVLRRSGESPGSTLMLRPCGRVTISGMPEAAAAPLAEPRPPRKLYRSSDGRWLGGVARGLAGHLGLPVIWVRLVFVGLFMADGLGALLYAAFWFFVPLGVGGVDAQKPPSPRRPRRPRRTAAADSSPAGPTRARSSPCSSWSSWPWSSWAT